MAHTRKAAPMTPAVTESSPARRALMKVAQDFSINLAPFPEEQAALAFKDDAAVAIARGVTSAETHQAALQLMRDGKRLKRAIDEHWQRVTRWLEDRKKDIRTIAALNLGDVEPGLAGLNTAILRYEDAEKARVRREQEAQRIEQERLAREARERDLAEMEKQALAAEQQSDQLSERERGFVQRVYAALGVDAASDRWLNATAKACGFKQDNMGVTLMGREKIRYALDAMKQAAAIRDQAAAVKEKPLEVRQPEVQANLGKVSGTRTVTTWTAECFDVDLFVDKVITGEVDRETARRLLQPNAVGGNEMARALHENMDRIHGWRHVKKVTKAG